MALERELETYRRRLPELLYREGQFVLIHGEELTGVMGSFDAALRRGYEEFGFQEPFFIRQIRAVEVPQFFPRRVSACEP